MIGGALALYHSTGAKAQALDPAVAEELAELAITDPVAFNAEYEKTLTPEEKEERALARAVVENPGEYYRGFVKPIIDQSPEAAGSFLAITNPVEAMARFERSLTPEQRAERDAALESLGPLAAQP